MDANKDKHRLLEEGAKSYVLANTALVEFRREVQTECRKTFEGQLDALSDALDPGLNLKPRHIVEWPRPSDTIWGGTEAGLGVRIADVRAPDGRRLSLYCGFYWDKQGTESRWFGTYNGIGFTRISYAESLMAALPKVPRWDVGQERGDVWLCEQLKPEEAPSFYKKLEESLAAWIGCWKQIQGGLRAIPA
jgi:hypothetical protein